MGRDGAWAIGATSLWVRRPSIFWGNSHWFSVTTSSLPLQVGSSASHQFKLVAEPDLTTDFGCLNTSARDPRGIYVGIHRKSGNDFFSVVRGNVDRVLDPPS